jgi:hypothetical protein
VSMKSWCVEFLLVLISYCFLSETKAQPPSDTGLVSKLVGTWQILSLDVAGYSSGNTPPIDYVRIQLGSDGTYRRIIQKRDTVSTTEGPKQADPEECEASYLMYGDTVLVHWLDPDYGDDYAGLFSLAGDTLLFRRIDMVAPTVRLVRITDTAAVPSLSYAPTTPIPSELVDRLKRFKMKNSPREIVKQLCDILSQSDSVAYEGDNGFLRVIVSNLDTDPAPEIIVLMGNSETMTEGYDLLVLKSFSSNWRIIYATVVDFWYKPPEIHVLDNLGPNRTFYTYAITIRGTGIYRDLVKFYKLIDGQVYNCLSTVHDMHADGWGPLNREVHAKVKALHNGEDEIRVRYKYRFWPGMVEKGNANEESHDDVSFISDAHSVDYRWEGRSRTYRSNLVDSRGGFNKAELRCLDTWVDDAQFVRAFDSETQDLALRGSDEQTHLLRLYIGGIDFRSTVQSPDSRPLM